MSIEIIDGFRLNRSVPIDERIVASGSTARNNIDYKYNGLRVFDTFDNIPYIWLNNTWVKENINALIAKDLKDNYLVKFNNITKGLTNSSIYDDGKTVFVNYTTIPNTIESVKLNVNGDIKASSFSGIGTNITSLNASQIQSGLMDIKYIKPGSNGEVLTTYSDSGTLKTKWDSIKNIQSFGVSINEIPRSTTESEYLILFGSIGTTNLYSSGSDNTHSISYKGGQLLLKTPSGKPTYSFKGNDTSGILLEDPNISFKVSNDKILEIDTLGLKITSGTLASPSLSFISDSTSGLYYNNTSKYIGFVNQNSDIFRVYTDRVSVKSFTTQSQKASISFNDDEKTGILFNNFGSNKNILFNINITNVSKEVLKIDSVDFIIKSDTITLGKSLSTTTTSLYFYSGTNESSIIYRSSTLELTNNNGGINFITAGKPITFSSGNGKLSFSNVITTTNSYSSVILSYNNTNTLEFRSNGTILTSNSSISFYKSTLEYADLTCDILTCNGFLRTNSLKIEDTQIINGIYLDNISWSTDGKSVISTYFDNIEAEVSGKYIKISLKPKAGNKLNTTSNTSLRKVLITSYTIKDSTKTTKVERLFSKIETNGNIYIEILFSKPFSLFPKPAELIDLNNLNIYAQIFIYS